MMAALMVALSAFVSVAVRFLAFFELVPGAAIGADGQAGFDRFNVDPGVHAPERRFGAGAIQGQVFGLDVHDLVFGRIL
jgi:hypothetical protein